RHSLGFWWAGRWEPSCGDRSTRLRRSSVLARQVSVRSSDSATARLIIVIRPFIKSRRLEVARPTTCRTRRASPIGHSLSCAVVNLMLTCLQRLYESLGSRKELHPPLAIGNIFYSPFPAFGDPLRCLRKHECCRTQPTGNRH